MLSHQSRNRGRRLSSALLFVSAAIAAGVLALSGRPSARPAASAPYQAAHSVGRPAVFLPAKPAQHGGTLAQHGPKPAQGKFLVAGRGLGDPNFAETVVLLVGHSEQGTMGIIINRATKVKVSELLPEIKSLEQRDEIVYIGGPVARRNILLLIQSDGEPVESKLVFGDVYVSSSPELLEQLAGESGEGTPFHVFAGHSGWAPGQLEAELAEGAWHILPASAAAVFDSEPSGVWPKLIDRTNLRYAGVGTISEGNFPRLAGLTHKPGFPRGW